MGPRCERVARPQGRRPAKGQAMRTFECREISDEELDAFSAQHRWGNFQQASKMGAVRRAEGVQIMCAGVFEAGELVAAAQVELHRSRLSTFAEIHNGPLMDLGDAELDTFFFGWLKGWAKRQGAAQLEVIPESPWRLRTTDGEEVDPAATPDELRALHIPADAFVGPDEAAFKNLTDLGFIHSGFFRGWTGVPRWRYIKDLTGITTEDELLASYSKNTRRNVRIARESGVTVERVGKDDLPAFHAIIEMSCQKQGFENRPLSYFQTLYDCFGDEAEFLVGYVDLAAHLASWEEKRDGFAADVARLEASLAHARKPERVQRQIQDARSKHESALRRIEWTRERISHDGTRVPASAALFVWHPRECVYLFSGADATYAKFYASTAIQHHIMLESVERGYDRYSFYGVEGIFDDPDSPGRGVLEFKQGFNGYVEELLGSFTLPVRPLVYKAKRLAHKVLGR